MLQEDWDGATTAAVIVVFRVIWDVRAMCRRGVRYGDDAALVALLWKCVQCPWLMRCCPTKDKRERRADRIRAPDAVPNAVIYRSDGASRGQGSHGDNVAGWGSAV